MYRSNLDGVGLVISLAGLPGRGVLRSSPEVIDRGFKHDPNRVRASVWIAALKGLVEQFPKLFGSSRCAVHHPVER
jgi:hypothetical protein